MIPSAVEFLDATIERDGQGAYQSGRIRFTGFEFESGEVLSDVDVAYETWGVLNEAKDNAVVVCHALTGDSHVAASSSDDGWWGRLIGPGAPIDTNRRFVIATNVLGGCSGSTGPSSLAPDGEPYGLRFPVVTIRDMVRAQIALVNALGVERVALVIGGSLGGMQAWEWAFLAQHRVEDVVVIAAHAEFSAIAIGYNEAMRQAIIADGDWQHGRYYGTGREPVKGLSAARTIGMLTYRTDELYHQRFGRRRSGTDGDGDVGQDEKRALTEPVFEVERYLRYQGKKLAHRFDANSYLYLLRAMDNHDIGRDRGGVEAALGTLSARLSIIGITNDYLYPPANLRALVEIARGCGADARYHELQSVYGHDAFLASQGELGQLIVSSLAGTTI